MNLNTLSTEIREELQETSASEWTAAEVTGYLNDGCRLIARLLEWYQKTANLVPVVGQQDYTLPTDVLRLQRVSYDRQFLPETTQYELDRDEGNWRAAGNNDPIRHFEKQWDTLSSYPKPKTAGNTVSFDSELGVVTVVEDPSGTPDPDVTFDSELGTIIAVEDSEGGQIRFEQDFAADPFSTGNPELGIVIDYDTDEGNFGLFYSALPDQLSASTDSPQLPTFVHPALVPYTVFRCLSREGPHQDIQLALEYFNDFGDWMTGVMELKNRRWPEGGKELSPAIPGSVFEKRLNEIGYGDPLRTTLKAHYE